MKIIELINKYKNTNSKDFEIEALYFIFEEYFKFTKSSLILALNQELENKDLIILEGLLKEYTLNNVPVQYLMHTAYFYGNKYYVDENVLIPRFDTEVLIDKIISDYKDKLNLNIIDIGTGSGCIAISLKMNLNSSVDAIDISRNALNVAKKNAKDLNQDINFIENDLLDNINKKYDIIVSNPPYIDKDEDIMDLVKNNEPHLALFSDDCGLYHYKKIIDQSINNLKEDGTLYFEIPDNKCDKIIEYANKYYKYYDVIKDYNNQRRVLVLRKDK